MKMLLGLFLSCGAFALDGDGRYVPVNYKEENFTALVDNFGYSGGNYTMRYFIKDEYYKSGQNNPLFFYCGNEGDVNMFIENSGYIDYLGDKMNALIIFAEHRYFGKSLPFGNDSFSTAANRRFLSPHQALADYANLITYIKNTHKNLPVIAWGGSYGGMLAAWFRMKYPNIVHGAIAASAPIFHFLGTVDPGLFSKIVTEDYARVSSSCPELINKAYKYLEGFATNETVFPQIQAAFNTCSSVQTAEDLGLVQDWLTNAFSYMAMTDYPYATNFLQKMPAWPVKAACEEVDQIKNPGNYSEVFGKIRDAANVYYSYGVTGKCSKIKQDFDDSRLGMDGWDYLACSTLNLPSGSYGMPKDMFASAPWNQHAENAACLKRWGVVPDVEYAAVYYGAANSSEADYPLRWVTNIVFSNGELDPWQSGAVTRVKNPHLVAFTMKDAAHHLDLRYPNTADPESVTQGRVTEKLAIEHWIKNYVAN